MRLIFIGSSEFGLPALQRLLEHDPPLLVVTQPDRPAGRRLKPRPCAVAEFAASRQLPLWQPEQINAADSLARISKLQPDLLITASYGGMLGKELRKSARFGAINLHPSLLPLYRGASPITAALLKGDSLTGVTIFKLTSRLDAGPILIQQKLPILPEDNFSSLQSRLSELAADLLLRLLERYRSGEPPVQQQDHSQASYTSKLLKSDLQIDWNQPALAVLNRIRAFSLEPGAFTWRGEQSLKILEAETLPEPANGLPGSITEIIRNTGFSVNCQDRQLLIRSVQPAGKRIMDAWAYQLGARLQPGELFSSREPAFSLPNSGESS